MANNQQIFKDNFELMQQRLNTMISNLPHFKQDTLYDQLTNGLNTQVGNLFN